MDLKKLVIRRDISEKLTRLGIHRKAAFYWKGESITTEETMTPAWTMEELRIMIGNKFLCPDLPVPRPRPNDGEEITFYLYTAQRGYEFSKGSDAAGEMLRMLIEERSVKPEDANKRYVQKFG